MIERIIKDVFSDFDRWKAFIELEEHKGKIFDYWALGYHQKLKHSFLEEFKEWKLDSYGLLDVYFSPTGFQDRKSLEIWIENGFQLSFWVNSAFFDIVKAKDLIIQHLELIERCLQQPIKINQNPTDPYIFKIQLNYDLPGNVNSCFNNLIYFADKELPGEIIKAIRTLLASQDIIRLFRDINNQCLK